MNSDLLRHARPRGSRKAQSHHRGRRWQDDCTRATRILHSLSTMLLLPLRQPGRSCDSRLRLPWPLNRSISTPVALLGAKLKAVDYTRRSTLQAVSAAQGGPGRLVGCKNEISIPWFCSPHVGSPARMRVQAHRRLRARPPKTCCARASKILSTPSPWHPHLLRCLVVASHHHLHDPVRVEYAYFSYVPAILVWATQ